MPVQDKEPIPDNGVVNVDKTAVVTTPQAVDISGVNPDSPTPKSGKTSIFKKITKTQALALGAALVIIGSAGAYFGVIIPNSPENVWDTALTRTAIGVDRLSDYVAENKEIKGGKIKGNFKSETSGIIVDGSFEGSQDEKNGSYKADIGAAGNRVKAEVLTNIPEGASSPDVYLKFNGLGSISTLLGATDPEVASFLGTLDNQWYVIDHTALDQLSSSATGSSETASLTADDILGIEEAVAKVNKQYLFSTESDKAVLEIVKFVGKEQLDDRKTYHYQVGINKENFKSYLTALKDELKNTKLAEIYEGDKFEEEINFNDWLKLADEVKDNSYADVWVDSSIKIIRKVQFNDEKSQSHLDFLVNYDGGNTYPFKIAFHSEEEGNIGTMVLSIELDTDKDLITFGLEIDYPNQSKASLNATIEKSDQPVDFTKPLDVKSFSQLIGDLGGGSLVDDDDSQLELEDVPAIGNFDL